MAFIKWLVSWFKGKPVHNRSEPALPRENWKLIHTYDVKVEFSSARGKESGIMFFHLHESDQGNRKMHVTSTINMDNVEGMAKMLPEYNTVIYPWLHGRYVPGIPSYQDIDSIDVQTRLSE